MKRIFVRPLFYVIVIGYAIVTIGPFLWSVFTSFKMTPDINTLWVPLERLTFENYENIVLSDEYPFALVF